MKKLSVLLLLAFSFGFIGKKKPITSKHLPKMYVYVPSGKVFTNVDEPNAVQDSLEGFYVSSQEVTNIAYKEFLYDLKQNGKMDDYHKYYPDTSIWVNKEKMMYGEPYMHHYFQHPAYKDYPVVGVSKEQAIAYCSWLSERIILKDKNVSVTFSLPTKKQWIRAARGDRMSTYSHGGPFLRNSKGCFLYNHKTTGGESIHWNEDTKKYEVVSGSLALDGGFITTPTTSYFPNEFGVYNTCGNVAEMILDEDVAMGGSWSDTGYDIRVESEQDASVPNAKVGFRVVAKLTVN